MRWANLILCLFLACAFTGAVAPVSATDLRSPRQTYPDDRPRGNEAKELELEEFCHDQRRICRKICNLRFRDDLIGCPQSCDSREVRCGSSGCYRWTEPEFLIAERFGGFKCP